MHLTGIKSRFQQDCVPFSSSKENVLPCPLLLLNDTHIAWIMAHFHHRIWEHCNLSCLSSVVTSFWQILFCLLLTLLLWALSVIQDNLFWGQLIRNLNSICNLNSFLPFNLTFSQLPGIRKWILPTIAFLLYKFIWSAHAHFFFFYFSYRKILSPYFFSFSVVPVSFQFVLKLYVYVLAPKNTIGPLIAGRYRQLCTSQNLTHWRLCT